MDSIATGGRQTTVFALLTTSNSADSTSGSSSGSKSRPATAPAIVSRIAASLVGGYVFVWGASALAICAMVALGEDYENAWMLSMLLAFLLFLGVFFWAWMAKSLLRVWLVLLGGGGLMTALALLLQQRLLAGG